MATEGDERGTIGVLVVHGIGAQEPGETLRKLLAGLRRVAPDAIPAAPADGVELRLCGQPMRFYEVYWADLLKGEITRGSFLIKELQSLAWFPCFNLWRGNYDKGSYGFFTLVWRLVTLPVMSALVLLGYFGARFLAQSARALTASGRRSEGETFAERVRHARARGTEATTLDQLLDEYVGDVLNYVNSAGEAFHRDDDEPPVPDALRRIQPAIVARFHEQLLRARSDGCATIHVVAHSLGTVVMYHALRGLGRAAGNGEAVRAAAARVRHLYTIGSPLEKIRFFWPRLRTSENVAGERPIVWDNFVSWFDPVAGMLRRYDEWGGVRNHRLLGGGFVRGHVVYEHSPVFLHALTEGLCGRVLPLRRSWPERLRDAALLLGETLLAPAGLALVVGMGAVVFALTALLLPFLLSLPFRLFVAPEIWVPIYDGAATVMAVMFAAVMILAPIIHAGRVHRLYWTANGATDGAWRGAAATTAEGEG